MSLTIAGVCASVARRAPGGPLKAEPGADAGPAAPRGAALINQAVSRLYVQEDNGDVAA